MEYDLGNRSNLRTALTRFIPVSRRCSIGSRDASSYRVGRFLSLTGALTGASRDYGW